MRISKHVAAGFGAVIGIALIVAVSSNDPVIEDAPVIEDGQVIEDPVTAPDITEPVTEPVPVDVVPDQVTEPVAEPVTEPPVTEPVITEPPVTEPVITEPPVTEPQPDPTWVLAEDGTWVPPTYWDPPAEVIYEDDPRWDCRWDGNQACGVEIHGMWYVIQFEDGSPVSVRVR